MPDSGTSFTWASARLRPVGRLDGRLGPHRGDDPGALEPRRHRRRLPLPADLADLRQHPAIADAGRQPVDQRRHLSAVHARRDAGSPTATCRRRRSCSTAGRLPGARADRLLGRRVRARRATATRSTRRRSTCDWFNPFAVELVLRRRRRPLALDLHLLGLGRHAHDERGDQGPREDPGPGRHDHRHHRSWRSTCSRGRADHLRRRRHRRVRARQPDIQGNVFFSLAGPILGPLAFLVSLAVLTSSASSLQSTFVSPARTLLAMGHYGALPPKFAKVSPRFFTPGLRDDRLGDRRVGVLRGHALRQRRTCSGTRSRRSA